MSEQREKQLIVVYSVVAVVVLYYAITYWLPYLQRALGLYLERSQVLQSVENEIQNDQFDVKELAEYKSKAEKLKEDVPKKVNTISPSFVLERRDGGPIKEPKLKQNNADDEVKKKPTPSIAPGYKLPAHSSALSRVVPTNTRTAEAPASTRAAVRSNPSLTAEPNNPTPRYLASFAPGSIEAQVHAEMAQRADPYGLRFDPAQLQREAEAEEARMVRERALREEQDEEYQQSLRKDQTSQLKLEEEQKQEERVRDRRSELASLVKPEPEPSKDGCITLQFRSRHVPTAATSKLGSNLRVKRRFLSDQHTAQDLLDFVESLELRPLLSPVSASCVLTLDFPTRVVSRDTESDKTLSQLGITADSVVWIKFEDE